MGNFSSMTLADFERKQAEIRAKVRTMRPLGKPDSVNKGGRPKSEIPLTVRQAARYAKVRAQRMARPVVSERLVLRACMNVLEVHPAVALWWRQNSAAFKMGGRFVKCGFVGASDLMLVLKGGRFGAVEVKATGKHATPEQAQFLANVADAGGCSICVDDAGKLGKWLDGLTTHAQTAQEGHQARRSATLDDLPPGCILGHL